MDMSIPVPILLRTAALVNLFHFGIFGWTHKMNANTDRHRCCPARVLQPDVQLQLPMVRGHVHPAHRLFNRRYRTSVPRAAAVDDLACESRQLRFIQHAALTGIRGYG